MKDFEKIEKWVKKVGKMQGALTVLRFEVEFEDLTKEQIIEKICRIIEIGD
jgi:hypothetical protein